MLPHERVIFLNKKRIFWTTNRKSFYIAKGFEVVSEFDDNFDLLSYQIVVPHFHSILAHMESCW